MWNLLSAAAAALTLTGAAQAEASRTPTAEDAQASIARAEADLERASMFGSHTAWVQNTSINVDANALIAGTGAEDTSLAVRYARETQAYDHVQLDPFTPRKPDLLKQCLALPALHTLDAAEGLADIQSRLTTNLRHQPDQAGRQGLHHQRPGGAAPHRARSRRGQGDLASLA
jgi:hypothetical protein